MQCIVFMHMYNNVEIAASKKVLFDIIVCRDLCNVCHLRFYTVGI